MPDDCWYAFTPPRQVETPRLQLRAHEPNMAAQLKAAIDANLEHLQRWMPWAMNEPSSIQEIERRIEHFIATFETGPSWGYVMFLRGEERVVGGIGIHASVGPRALELGYWMDERYTGRGLATEATGALTELALSLPDVDRVEIRCDPNNVASAAIPRRLGYRYVTTLEKNTVTPTGAPRDTMVFELVRTERETPS
jgi:RimJ/RimL family protein N-acetyltransferase